MINIFRRPLFVIAILFWPTIACADLLVEHQSTKSNQHSTVVVSSGNEVNYAKVMLVREDIVAFQLYVDGFLIKEVGMRPEENIYYEIDPERDIYEKYPISLLKKEHAQIKAGMISGQSSIAQVFFGTGNSERKESPIRPIQYESKKALWGHGKLADWDTIKYKLKAVRGGQVIGEESVWIVDPSQLPPDYVYALSLIRDGLSFYRGTQNEFSRHINLISAVEGVIVKASGSESHSFGFLNQEVQYSDQLVRIAQYDDLSDDKFMYFYKDKEIKLTDVSSSANSVLYKVADLSNLPKNTTTGYQPSKVDLGRKMALGMEILRATFGVGLPTLIIMFLIYGVYRMIGFRESFLPENGYLSGTFATCVTIVVISGI
ncbi:MAG: hypothetical protein ACI959_002040, partial [Limisphaerales bacterium]